MFGEKRFEHVLVFFEVLLHAIFTSTLLGWNLSPLLQPASRGRLRCFGFLAAD